MYVEAVNNKEVGQIQRIRAEILLRWRRRLGIVSWRLRWLAQGA